MKIKEFKQSLATINDIKQKIKAFEEKAQESDLENKVSRDELFSELNSMFSFIMDEIDFVHMRLNRFVDDHLDGHLPKIKSNQQLNQALDVLGLDDEYEVVPQRVSVAYNQEGHAENINVVLAKQQVENGDNEKV